MTLATVLGVLLHDPARRTATRVARAALVVLTCAVTALVAVGVIGLRWHYFTDTVGGVALGTGTVLTLAFLIDLVPGVMRSRGVRNGDLLVGQLLSCAGQAVLRCMAEDQVCRSVAGAARRITG
jgi:hypothetical protein